MEQGLRIKMKFMHAWVNGVRVIPIVHKLIALSGMFPHPHTKCIHSHAHTHTLSLSRTHTHRFCLDHAYSPALHSNLTVSMTSSRNPFPADPSPHSRSTRLG